LGAFVVTEVNGTWQTAIKVPGMTDVNSMSCALAGNCSAGGSNYSQTALVVNEVNGIWHAAIQVPGTATLDHGQNALVTSVSCPSAGNCAAGGNYWYGATAGSFVVNEANGTWHTAIEVPGLAALQQGSGASLNSLSCGAAGSSYNQTALVVNEVNGIWHAVIQVPGTATLDHGQHALVTSVSCPSAGNCAAGGNYWYGTTDGSFVANEVNGTWHTAIQVPGLAALGYGSAASLNSLSCGAAGSCSAGGNVGYYGYYGSQAFVVSEK